MVGLVSILLILSVCIWTIVVISCRGNSYDWLDAQSLSKSKRLVYKTMSGSIIHS